jgi:ribosomal protein S18 acetylase RimI-like enzyme
VIEVRPCSTDDLVALQRHWPHPVHLLHFERRLTEDADYLVAWRSERPLGSVVVVWSGDADWRAELPEPGPWAEVRHLQVRSERRREGAGKALVAGAVELARARGIPCVSVWVADDNEAARALYAGLGFDATGRFEISEYEWLDEAGQAHHAVERNELMTRSAPPSSR